MEMNSNFFSRYEFFPWEPTFPSTFPSVLGVISRIFRGPNFIFPWVVGVQRYEVNLTGITSLCGPSPGDGSMLWNSVSERLRT